jgi:pimeloyl-ACP methyl ester carboxylesterase
MAMRLVIDGLEVYAATGGRVHEAGRPLALFVHGAGFDHTAWALQSRWLAFHGWNVLAPDLPGHGSSAGAPLSSVESMAVWLGAVIAATPPHAAALIGHSMGSLAALETAARSPAGVTHLVLIAAAAAMPVHPELLAAAAADEHAAIDMVNRWGHGFAAGMGGNSAPGQWMIGAGERVLERAQRGVLHADLAACNAYAGGVAAAAQVTRMTLVIAGERDQMTPLARGRALAAAIAGASLETLPRAGHMLMAERPDAVRSGIGRHLDVAGRRSASA